jgi:hypothetical protein
LFFSEQFSITPIPLAGAGYQWLQLDITENNVTSTQIGGVLLGGEGDYKPAAKQDPATVVQRLVV